MSFIDRLFVGKVIKDFGHLELHSFGIGKRGRSVLLAEKRGELYFIVKSFAWAVFGGSVRYFTFKLINALKLREFINESEQIALGSISRDNVGESHKLFVGRTVRDFGCVEQEKLLLGKTSKTAFLAERKGDPYLFLKFSQWAFLGWNMALQHFSLEDAYKLREYIEESERIAASLPPSAYDPKTEANLNAALIALATIVSAIIANRSLSTVASVLLLMICIQQIRIFWHYADTRVYVSLLMIFLTLCNLVVTGIRVAPAIGL